MRKYRRKKINFIIATCLTAAVTAAAVPETAEASTISEIQENINEHQNELNSINSSIAELEDEQDILEEQIADLNAEIINTMACIGLKEDEIIAKEAEITIKQHQIDETEAEYEAAVEREEKQRSDMVECARMVYENNAPGYLTSLLEGKGISEVLNQMDYVERVYQYSVAMLNDYIMAKNATHDLWDFLEEEKAGLEQDRAVLEADREELRELEKDLGVKLDKKKKESANFEAEIKRAKKEAEAAKKLLQEDKRKLKQLQAAQAAQAAANATYATTNYTSTIDNASGSSLGKQVAKYACQFIGNPYVYGGTSLTNGTDCSGFTYRVYQQFGYGLPRTSSQQRSAGKSVSYQDAQPGDLICYDGHVGMYIGGGLIVHASNERTGIKVSRAQYRTILSVRRII